MPPGTNAGAAFDTRVYLQTPYSYDPASGNLLMDLKISTNSSIGVPTSPFDGENSGSDSISRVYATSAAATTATVADSRGVITQFMFGDTTPTLGSGIGWFMTAGNFTNISTENSGISHSQFRQYPDLYFNQWARFNRVEYHKRARRVMRLAESFSKVSPS